MYVSAQAADTAQSAYQGAQLSQQRVTSYVELVSSTRVSEEVIRRLGWPSPPRTSPSRSPPRARSTRCSSTSPSPARRRRTSPTVANAVGAVFPRLVDELERPSSPTGTPPVAVRVVQPAPCRPPVVDRPAGHAGARPARRARRRRRRGALARNALDTSVKSPGAAARRWPKAPNLGVIAFDAAGAEAAADRARRPAVAALGGVPAAADQPAVRRRRQPAQGHRRHQLDARARARPRRWPTSRIALASAGQRVLAIEADLRRPKLADLLGLERSVGLTSVLAGRVARRAGGAALVGRRVRRARQRAAAAQPERAARLAADGDAARRPARASTTSSSSTRRRCCPSPTRRRSRRPPTARSWCAGSRRPRRDQVRTAVRGARRGVGARCSARSSRWCRAAGPRAYAQYNSYYRTEQPTALVEDEARAFMNRMAPQASSQSRRQKNGVRSQKVNVDPIRK